MNKLTAPFLFLLLIVSAPGMAQGPAQVKAQAQQMGAALVGRDYAGFVAFTYPKILEEMGGKPGMAVAIEKQMAGMQKSGNKIVSISYGTPSAILTEGKELQCTIPQTMELETRQGKIVATTTLIGISQDKGVHWYFIDAGGRDLNAVRASLPNISKKLVIPAGKEPVFVPKPGLKNN